MDCNLIEKCEKMRKGSLRLLLDDLKRALKVEKNFGKSRKIIDEIEEEISSYECEAMQIIKQRILAYKIANYQGQRERISMLLCSELDAFLSE